MVVLRLKGSVITTKQTKKITETIFTDNNSQLTSYAYANAIYITTNFNCFLMFMLAEST